MKKLFILLPALALSLFACNVAGDEDYKALAKDACDCVNKSTESLSPEMKKVIMCSDNAEKYSNNLFPVIDLFVFKQYGIQLELIAHSETQGGKGPWDIQFRTVKICGSINRE